MKDYKKILEGIVDIINTTEKSDIGFVEICDYIGEHCPELKEIRRGDTREELISFLEELSKLGRNTNFDKWTTYDCAKWIEWVKKQDPTLFEEELEKAYMKGYNDAKYEVEKQGKKCAIVWHSMSEEPEEQEELLCEWESEDATWHDIAFYHADTKMFWNGAIRIKNVIRWTKIADIR